MLYENGVQTLYLPYHSSVNPHQPTAISSVNRLKLSACVISDFFDTLPNRHFHQYRNNYYERVQKRS
jgi:hypothetical protein